MIFPTKKKHLGNYAVLNGSCNCRYCDKLNVCSTKSDAHFCPILYSTISSVILMITECICGNRRLIMINCNTRCEIILSNFDKETIDCKYHSHNSIEKLQLYSTAKMSRSSSFDHLSLHRIVVNHVLFQVLCNSLCSSSCKWSEWGQYFSITFISQSIASYFSDSYFGRVGQQRTQCNSYDKIK